MSKVETSQKKYQLLLLGVLLTLALALQITRYFESSAFAHSPTGLNVAENQEIILLACISDASCCSGAGGFRDTGTGTCYSNAGCTTACGGGGDTPGTGSVCTNVTTNLNLNQSVNSTGTCFVINASNIILNCSGYKINYSTAGRVGYGINNSAGYKNVTIKNCYIEEGNVTGSASRKYGIYSSNTDNITIWNNTIRTRATSSYGIYINDSLRTNITDNKIFTSGSSGYGAYFSSSNFSTVQSNNFTVTGDSAIAIYAGSSSERGTIFSNAIVVSGSGGYGIYAVTSSYNNISFNNITMPTSETNDVGIRLEQGTSHTIVDSNNVTNLGDSSSGGSSIGIQLITSTLNNSITSNKIVTTGTSTNGITLGSSANSNLLTFNEISTSGSSAEGILVETSSSNNSILSNNITTSSGTRASAIKLAASTGNNISTNLLTASGGGTSYGIYLTAGSNSSTILGNNITASASYGILLELNSKENLFMNNNLSDSLLFEIYDNTTADFNNSLAYSNTFGEIRWINNGTGSFLSNLTLNVTNGLGLGLGRNIFIGNNTLAINTSAFSTAPAQSTALARINSTANITLYGLDLSSVNIIRKVTNFTANSTEVVMAGGDCIGTGCSNISYTGNTLIFNVTSLSSYSGNFTFFNFAPTFSNASNTSPNFRRYQNFTANISISDDRELDYYIFSTNASGAWTNVTVDVSGTQYNASHQANITSSKNSLVCWYYWANDTFKNFENSTRYCFTVRNTLPRFKTSLTAQSVQVGRSLSYQIECEDDDASDTITYYDNTTLFDIGSATGLISHTPAAADIGTYTANITCGDGDDNVSETFAYTISAAAAEAAAAVAAGGGGGGSRYECKSNADCPKDKYCVKNICLKIFDLKILYLDSPIPPGEYLDFTYFVKGMADISGDVTFDFKVEQDTQIVSSGSDVIFIGSFEEKTEMTQLTLPSDLTEGTYTFTVTLRFEEYEISSSRTFEVRKETPFLPSVTILDLPVIEPNYQWNYSFIIGVNKDEPVSAVVERKISTAERTIWSKQESLVLNRSQIINDVIPGLEEGNYLLEVRAQIENHTATASQTLMIGTPSEEPSEKPKAGKAKALAGQSIFARLFLTTYDFTTIWVGGVMALFMILLLTSLIRKKKAKKLLFTPPPSLDGLEQWVREMQAMRTPTPEIIKIALEQTKWTEEDLRTVLARIDATQQLQAHYGEYLTEKMLNDLRAYITACTKKDIYKGEVITTLLHQGWDRQAIEPYVVAYYR